jgi:TDG/mug DNA glycosylase family protein
MVLPDILKPNLKVVFCGTAVGDKSAQAGAYYAGPRNSFWSTLTRVGLTTRRLDPQEFRILPRYGIGLTDLAKGLHGPDRRVRTSDFDTRSFRLKIEKFNPKVVAFNGKRAARAFLGRDIQYGLQAETIGKSAIFVLPSTSGAARRYWDQSHWSALSDFLQNAST